MIYGYVGFCLQEGPFLVTLAVCLDGDGDAIGAVGRAEAVDVVFDDPDGLRIGFQLGGGLGIKSCVVSVLVAFCGGGHGGDGLGAAGAVSQLSHQVQGGIGDGEDGDLVVAAGF